MTAEITERIRTLQREKNAVILAHNYQIAEVQDVADYVGDSLGLAQQAAQTDADVIVFAGVHFMAETAAILSPDKTVLLTDVDAGCPMADMITGDQLRQFKSEHPGVPVVTYVNSSADVKAESDWCCTSSNAVNVVEAVPSDEVLFVPDKYLGHYVSTKTEKKVTTWNGYCPTHSWLSPEDIELARSEHPNAEVLVHPECRPEVVAVSDHALSTGQMIDYATKSSTSEFIIGTEIGIIHQLETKNPQKSFFIASRRLVCPNMKRTTLEKVLWSLEDMSTHITVDPEIAGRSRLAIQRMLDVSAHTVKAGNG